MYFKKGRTWTVFIAEKVGADNEPWKEEDGLSNWVTRRGRNWRNDASVRMQKGRMFRQESKIELPREQVSGVF